MMIKSLNEKECTSILANNYIGNLAYIYRDRPFIVPMTYYFDNKNTIIGYSHEGHKIMAMRKNSRVSLDVSEIKNVDYWKSVLAHGIFEELSGTKAKGKLHEFAVGIKDLVLRKEEKNLHFISEFSSKTYSEDMPVVFKITIDEITGKSRVQ